MRPPRVVPLIAAVALAAACSGAEAPQPVASATLPDVLPTGPLADLPGCEPAPRAVDHAPVEGLVLPDSAIVTEVADSPPIVNVLGYIPRTPSEARRAYEAMDGIELLNVEDEVYDAEVLVSDGTHRVYAQFLAVCNRGARFVAVVAPQQDASALPTVPAQAP